MHVVRSDDVRGEGEARALRRDERSEEAAVEAALRYRRSRHFWSGAQTLTKLGILCGFLRGAMCRFYLLHAALAFVAVPSSASLAAFFLAAPHDVFRQPSVYVPAIVARLSSAWLVFEF